MDDPGVRQHGSGGGSVPPVDQDGEVSLRVYFETLWRYKQVVAAAVGLVTIVFVLTVLVFCLRFPVERVAAIQFRLMFEGAAQNKYPNGTPFSPADIVSAPVVAEVFQTNDLQRFGSYEGFKQSLYVQQASQALSSLASEYE